jgi:hypothetical protein
MGQAQDGQKKGGYFAGFAGGGGIYCRQKPAAYRCLCGGIKKAQPQNGWAELRKRRERRDF